MKSRSKHLINLLLSAMFIAIGIVLPFFTGQIQQVGKMLLPMHLPVFLCGLICGWPYGLAVGAILPVMRSFLFSAPVMYPSAIAMSFELATYGFVAGFLFSNARWQCVKSLYRCIITAMLAGRLVWGVVMLLLSGVAGNTFTFTSFVATAFAQALPGIILQLLLIPGIMLALDKTHIKPFRKSKSVKATKNGT